MEKGFIRLDGILRSVRGVNLSETLGLLQIIAPTRLSINCLSVIEIGDFLNPIIIGKIKKVEEKETGIFYQNDIWFDCMKKSDNEIPSFTCRNCSREYEGKPNYQMKSVKPGDECSQFFCDSCRINFTPDSLYFGNTIRIPLDKDKIEEKNTCGNCCKVIEGFPEFNYLISNTFLCGLDCAKRKNAEGFRVLKYQKLKGNK